MVSVGQGDALEEGGHDGSRRGPGEPRLGRGKRGGWMEEEEKKAGVNESRRTGRTGGGEVRTRGVKEEMGQRGDKVRG